MGVESRTGDEVVVLCTIEKIPHQWVSQMCHVDTNLVGASRV